MSASDFAERGESGRTQQQNYDTHYEGQSSRSRRQNQHRSALLSGWNRYTIIREIGAGSFARVYEAWDRRERSSVALKLVVLPPWKTNECLSSSSSSSSFQMGGDSPGSRFATEVENEANLLRYFQREGGADYGIVPFYDFYRTGPEICLVMPLYGRSIFSVLECQPFRGLPLDHVRSIAFDLLSALKFLHARDYAHTDIKPENLVLLTDGVVASSRYGWLPACPRVRLIDYGSTFWVHDANRPQLVTTRYYRPLEVMLELHWDVAIDLWSVGCLLVELLTGATWFQTHSKLEHFAMMEAALRQPVPPRIVQSALDRYYSCPSMATSTDDEPVPLIFRSDLRLRWPELARSRGSIAAVRSLRSLEKLIPPVSLAHSHLLDLIRKLVRFEPEERLAASRALQHPFFCTQKR